MSIFEKKCKKTHDKKDYYTIGDFFDIGNGMVTGLDKAFQIKDKLEILNENEKSSIIKVLKAKDLSPYYYHNITPYIFLPKNLTETDFIDNYNNFFEHLAPYKINLENRYNYNKNIPFWEWVFLRNFNLFSRSEKRIFVPSKERISNKKYFRFALVDQDIYPTQDVTGLLKKAHTKETLEYITAYLNSDKVFDWLVVNGIIKGGIVEFSEKPLASIPYRAIDWNNPSEVKLHNDITLQTQQYIKTQDIKILEAIKRNFNILFQD
jgi:adenine-specific DNA-methyltransferase